MDYFKHYSTASDSKLINHLFDEYRHTGYAYWFLLLELCAENWDGKSDPSFKFHTRIVRQKLRISLQNLELFLTKCSTFCDIKFKLSKNELELHIPKLAEVKTSRSVIKSNKKQLTVYKEIDIEIDIETTKKSHLELAESRQNSTVKKLSEKGSIVSPEWIVLEYFNAVNGKSIKQIDANHKLIKTRLKEGFTVDEMKLVIDHTFNNWTHDPFWGRLNRISTIFNGKFNDYLDQAQNASKPIVDPLDAFIAKYENQISEGA